MLQIRRVPLFLCGLSALVSALWHPARADAQPPRPPQRVDTEDSAKYALLVGVTDYRHDRMNDARLKFPEADARAVGELLESSGYTVVLLLGKQATHAAVTEALETLSRQGAADGVCVVGLFGHGVQYVEDAFFCPYDTTLRKVIDSRGETQRDRDGRPRLEPDPKSMIALRSVLDALALCGAGNRVILADCCRNDPSAARGRAFGSELKISALPRGTAALFSCSARERAFEHDDWKHGAFTYALLQECRRIAKQSGRVRANSLSVPVFDRVQDLVAEKTDGRARQSVNPIINGIVDLQLTAAVASPAPRMEVPTPPMETRIPPPGPMPTSRSPEGDAAGEVRTFTDLGISFCWCPPGEFLMGSPKSDDEAGGAEQPQHRVRLTKGFWLGQTELTQEQWQTVMGTTPWSVDDNVTQDREAPATYVSWEDAREFCRKLTQRELASGRLPSGWSYRLPTEAEWEYACRAGTTTLYSFGDNPEELGQHAWFHENAGDVDEDFAHLVRQKRANPWNLYDMHGNVWELCSDRYDSDYYEGAPMVDPQGPSEGTDRVRRGGSWRFTAWHCRSAFRYRTRPSDRSHDRGLRLALSPSGE